SAAPHRRRLAVAGVNQPLVFEALQRDEGRGAGGAPARARLDGVADRDRIAGVAETEHGQEDDELELAERCAGGEAAGHLSNDITLIGAARQNRRAASGPVSGERL